MSGSSDHCLDDRFGSAISTGPPRAQYTLVVLGFTDCSEAATPSNVLYTLEMAIDVACVYAILVVIQSIG